MQHLELPYFQVNGVYFQGDEVGAKNESQQWFEKMDKPFNNDDFEEWCNENCLLVEEDYEYIDDNYLVLTKEEADEAAKEYIEESVWAFNAEFICGYGSKLIPMVKAYQEKECEGANDAILELITDLDDFTRRAIKADGRGHFMNSYDGREHEVNIDGTYYYVYRMN